MKAARVQNGILQILEVPVPSPGPEAARVRICAAGVCHSDLHLARGDWDGVGRSLPCGHEGIGIVEELGPGAERYVNLGARVILGLGGVGGGYWCGACEYCLRGEPRHCPAGKGIMGVLAEHFCVFAKSLVELPESVGDEDAPLACGGLTAYGAVKKLTKHGIQPGRTVAILGAAGGLGHYAVQIAKAFGYRVVGVDVGDTRLKFVESLGADLAIGPDDAVETVMREFGGVDASIAFTTRIAGFHLGLEMLRRGGLFVAVGIPASGEGKLTLDPWQLFLRDPTIVYSAVGNVQDMREVVAMAAAGRLKTHVGRVGKLSELPAIFDELGRAAYLGRAVVTNLAS